MNNPILRDQLQKALKEGKIKVTYPDGYKAWKKKFDYFYGITKDLNHTLDAIYGPNGGVNNYKGSITANSDFKVPDKPKAQKSYPNKKPSGALKHLKKK